jgi:hypothetical protein
LKAVAGLALVMSSVSITVPFIPDLVKFNKRGLAYAWLTVCFLITLIFVYGLLEMELHKVIDSMWLYVIIGLIGILTDIIMFGRFSDRFK